MTVPLSEIENAESLLDGTYFHEELINAFRELCKRPNDAEEQANEVDLFVTGTDLDGHPRRYQDGLGTQIEDKEHRVVFQLKHRPGRRALGIRKPKSVCDHELQAKILGTVARITAGFPGAFPPIRETDIKNNDTLGPEVLRALDDASRIIGKEARDDQ